jgi:hypothetical protein
MKIVKGNLFFRQSSIVFRRLSQSGRAAGQLAGAFGKDSIMPVDIASRRFWLDQ